MNTTMLIKTDKALKVKAQKLAKEMGLPLGTLVNNYLKTFVIGRPYLPHLCQIKRL